MKNFDRMRCCEMMEERLSYSKLVNIFLDDEVTLLEYNAAVFIVHRQWADGQGERDKECH